MKVIAIYHNKGGVGKTTLAVNLAASYKNYGKRVLLIDIDSQANSTFAAGLAKFQFEQDDDLKDKNILNVLESGTQSPIEQVVRKSSLFNNGSLVIHVLLDSRYLFLKTVYYENKERRIKCRFCPVCPSGYTVSIKYFYSFLL